MCARISCTHCFACLQFRVQSIDCAHNKSPSYRLPAGNPDFPPSFPFWRGTYRRRAALLILWCDRSFVRSFVCRLCARVRVCPPSEAHNRRQAAVFDSKVAFFSSPQATPKEVSGTSSYKYSTYLTRWWVHAPMQASFLQCVCFFFRTPSPPHGYCLDHDLRHIIIYFAQGLTLRCFAYGTVE